MVEYHYIEIKKGLIDYGATESGLATIPLRDLVAIDEHRFYRWINFHAAAGGLEVIALAGFYINITDGVPMYVTSIDYSVIEPNKECGFELGTTANVDAGGAFTPRTPRFYFERGAADTFTVSQYRPFTIPIDIIYSGATCRTLTMRILAEDNATSVMFAMKGYYID